MNAPLPESFDTALNDSPMWPQYVASWGQLQDSQDPTTAGRPDRR